MTDDIIKLDQGYYYGEISSEKLPNGFGILLSSEGLQIEEGYWEQGKLFGLARQVRIFKNDVLGVTEGTFKQSKRNGFFTQKYSNGESFEGYFIDDLREGLGKYIYQDGHFYEGDH